MTIGKVHLTGRYARYRIRSPKSFKKGTFRTQDIGRIGHTKRIAGILKSGKWATQSVLVSRPDYAKGVRVVKRYGRPAIVKLKRVM
jgi:hypothetical protein